MTLYKCNFHQYLFEDKAKHIEYHGSLNEREQKITGNSLPDPVITKATYIERLNWMIKQLEESKCH